MCNMLSPIFINKLMPEKLRFISLASKVKKKIVGFGEVILTRMGRNWVGDFI